MLVDMNTASVSYQSVLSATSVSVATEVEEEASESVSTVANQDTYTPSAEAVAYMAEENAADESEATDEVDSDSTTSDVVDTDVSGTVEEDVEVEDTDVEVEDTDVDVEDTDVEEEVEEEAEDEVLDGLESLSNYTNLDGLDMKLTLMTNQMNTFVAMMNTFNSGSVSESLSSLFSESWVSDASTFSYAGKYMAQTAAGTTGIQQQAAAAAAEETESTTREIEYNNFSITGHIAGEGYETTEESE